jgi:hypothetical protein
MNIGTAFIYILIIVGMLICSQRRIILLYNAIKNRGRLSGANRERNPYLDDKEMSILLRAENHLKNLLFLVAKGRLSITSFLALCIIVFFVILLSTITHLPLFASFVLAGCFSVLPYIFLRVYYEKLRTKASFEGELLISTLVSKYFVSGGNIILAIEEIVNSDIKLPISKRILEKMLIDIRTTGSIARMKHICDSIYDQIKTSWSKMLAYNIWLCVSSGMDIQLALEDISKQLMEAKKLSEERSRINSESVRMVVFLIPLLYISSVFAMIIFLNLSPLNYLKNQFFSTEGFFMFFMSVFLFLVNLGILEIVGKKKLDF